MMDLEQINDTYGKLIWSIAGRYRTGVWDQTDVYNEILLMTFSAMERGKIPSDGLKDSYKLITGFVICRAIDIIRKEYKRKGIGSIYHNRETIELVKEHRINSSDEEFVFDDDLDLDTTASESEPNYEMEKRFILEMLLTHLPLRSALFIYELAFPSRETIDIAMEDQFEAQQDTKLRMNVNTLRVLPKHVAKSLGDDFKLSKATMSRIRKNAREVCREIIDVEIKHQDSYVTVG